MKSYVQIIFIAENIMKSLHFAFYLRICIILPNVPCEFHILCKLNLIILTAFS